MQDTQDIIIIIIIKAENVADHFCATIHTQCPRESAQKGHQSKKYLAEI